MIETLLNMDPWVITTFVGASIVLYLTPGADMMFVIASGVKGGPKAGVAATAGVTLGVLSHVTLAAAGLARSPRGWPGIEYLKLNTNPLGAPNV